MPDDLDRLFERLVSVLADDAPGRLAVPFPAAEVYERLVPYRSNRSMLKVATHQDYEMAVLRLLAGERGYATLEPAEVRDALLRETGESNPDTGLFRQFPDAILSLNRLAAERFLRGDRAYAPPPPPPLSTVPEAADAAEPEEEEPDKAPLAGAAFELAEQSESPRQCPYCGETLPGSRKVNFCPQCGQPPSGELRCPACGGEVDVGWRYCVSCGRATGFE
ncbi:MAG TPA: zinc ribbon domain-containing protein [Gemmatimonadales bacterium]|nr:zinc ribbon domain-containing protein [Gemmatimonadales bacterium]